MTTFGDKYRKTDIIASQEEKEEAVSFGAKYRKKPEELKPIEPEPFKQSIIGPMLPEERKKLEEEYLARQPKSMQVTLTDDLKGLKVIGTDEIKPRETLQPNEKEVYRELLQRTARPEPVEEPERPGLPGVLFRTLAGAGKNIAITIFSGLRALTEPSKVLPEEKALADKIGVMKWANELKKLVQSQKVADFAKGIIEDTKKEQIELLAPIYDKTPGLSNWQEYVHTIVSGSISMLEAVAITVITKSPTIGAAFITALDTLPEYNDAREAGNTPDEARRLILRSGTGTFILESIALNFMFSKIGGGRIIRAIKISGVETLQEELQTYWQNLNKKYSYDETQKIFEGSYETAVGIALPAFGMGLIVPGFSPEIQRSNLIKELQRGGLTKDEAEKTVTAMVEVASRDREQFEKEVKAGKEGIIAVKEEVVAPVVEPAIEKPVPIAKPIAKEVKPTISKELEPLAEEARKYKSAEEFIESVRLPAGIESDTAKLAELNKMSKEEAIRLYDSIEEFNESKVIVKRNLEFAKKELARLKLETNVLAEQTIDLLRKANIEGRGWFDQARNFYTQATKEIKPVAKPKVVKKKPKPKPKPVKKPIKKKPTKAPKKVSKVAKSIEAKAIEKGLIEKGFRELAEFTPETVERQSRLIDELIKSGMDRVHRIVNGQESLPSEINAGMFVSTIDTLAMETRDGKLALDLLNSPLVTETSVAGQTLRFLQEREQDSATAKMNELKKAREKGVEKRRGKKSEAQTKEQMKKQLEKRIRKTKPSKYAWTQLIDEIQC